jgi:hypothetical protein
VKTVSRQLPVGSLLRRAFAFAIWAAVQLSTGISEASDHGSHAANPAHAEPQAVDPNINSRGIDLGEYLIRSHYPVQAQKSIVRFALFATTQKERMAEIRTLAEHRKHKIRDQVIIVSRLIPLALFDEPDLKTFRRRILLRLRRALPELVIDEVYVSDIQLKVQSM